MGGFITDTWSWPWLFLINVVPGLIAALATPHLLPCHDTDLAELKGGAEYALGVDARVREQVRAKARFAEEPCRTHVQTGPTQLGRQACVPDGAIDGRMLVATPVGELRQEPHIESRTLQREACAQRVPVNADAVDGDVIAIATGEVDTVRRERTGGTHR